MSHLMTCGDAPPIARGQTWLFQPLAVSTMPNTGRNQSDSGYRGLDEEDRLCSPHFISYVCKDANTYIAHEYIIV